MLIEPVKLNVDNQQGENVLLSIYDFNKNTDKLGIFLIYLHLLFIHVKRIKEISAIQPCFINSEPNKNGRLLEYLLRQIEFTVPVLPVIKGSIAKNVFAWFWPPIDCHNFNFDSTNQHFYYFEKYGNVPSLALKDNNIISANHFLKRVNSKESLVITAHLKYQNEADGQSNANLHEWKVFFKNAVKFKNCIFVLLGRDNIKEHLSDIEELFFSSEYDLSLGTELALIRETDFFMGMSSGLCQIAIFNNKPYAIFKNPGHHVEQMKKENIIDNKLPFADSSQRFLIEWDLEKVLQKEFRRMVTLRQKEDSVICITPKLQ